MHGNYPGCLCETRKKVEFPISCGKNIAVMIRQLKLLFPVLAPVVFSGCLTLVDDSTLGEQRADADLAKAEVRKLSEQVTEMRQSLAKLEEDVRSLQGSRANDTKESKARIDEIDRSLKMIESSRDQMKQEIIDNISKRVADLMKATGGAAVAGSSLKGTSKRPVDRSKGAAVEKGVEHVVKLGETLTEIASAYGVKSSVILKANGMTNPNSIRVGQKIFIPE